MPRQIASMTLVKGAESWRSLGRAASEACRPIRKVVHVAPLAIPVARLEVRAAATATATAL